MILEKLKAIKIGINQYLKDVLTQIEINIIFFKFLTGIGLTTLEIENKKRNSLVLEPNVPVIMGKCKKYNKSEKKLLLGVYEGINKDDIVDYLENDVKPKKIICTPESFSKVKEAMDDLHINMYKDYFMLFDECERTIQDISYRSDIILPMNDFFKFKRKAFVSATPIMPSDPRFKSFKTQKIEPTFDYKQNLQLLFTNNVLHTFKMFLDKHEREQYFIFFNSTNSIAYLIDTLGIKEDSAVFCSKESRNKLKLNGYTNVHMSLGKFRKYNFLTSRFSLRWI